MRHRFFTLTEILVVIAIIVILAGILIAGMGFAGRRADQARTQASIQILATALERFHSENGYYPPAMHNRIIRFRRDSPNDVLKLVLEPAPGSSTSGNSTPWTFEDKQKKAYIDLEGIGNTPSDYADAWGQALQYRCPGQHNKAAYDLWSTGPDGPKPLADQKDDDDITNWQ